ncbi:MAG: NERD domain-containing protein [Methanobrevibacter sp.]|jgi:hypothetical protein|nr:NERD domain-containing protein [Candidatus Methanovirga basalitermitum]
MKTVICEHCGAKFSLKDHEFSYNFECSVCAGNLVEEQGYSQNLDSWYLKSEKNISDTYVVKCKNCGLKYVLNSNEETKDYQCSICSGDLIYFDEEEIIPETDNNLDSEVTEDVDGLDAEVTEIIDSSDTKSGFEGDNLNLKDDSGYIDDVDTEISFNTNDIDLQVDVEENKVLDSMVINQEEKHQVVKNHFKEDFIGSLDKTDENPDTKTSVVNNLKNETDNSFLEDVDNKETVSTVNEISSIEPEHNKSRIPHNTPVNFGLIIVCIGIMDIVTTVREYGYYLILFGFIVFVIGVILYKKHYSDELRSRIFRKNLSKLPKDFYILHALRLPGLDEIDHVIIGSTGIFSILTENVKNIDQINIHGKDTAYENSTEEMNPQSTETHTIISSPLSYKKVEKVKKSNKISLKFKYNEKIKFNKHDKIKKNSIRRSEELINLLYENNFSSFHLEPLVGFINDKILVNIPLTDENILLNDFLDKIFNGKRRLSDEEVKNISNFLFEYSH